MRELTYEEVCKWREAIKHLLPNDVIFWNVANALIKDDSPPDHRSVTSILIAAQYGAYLLRRIEESLAKMENDTLPSTSSDTCSP